MSLSTAATTEAGDLSGRQRRILEVARQSGEVQVEDLAESLDVTPQTIRRDLNVMCDMRLLQRVHGGAVVRDGVSNLGYEARRNVQAAEKSAIGKLAADLIPDDSSLFINIGTTTEEAARHLGQHRGLLVVTNNINVIESLRHNQTARFMIAGGTVRNEDGGIVGDATAEYMDRFQLDHAIVGVSSIEYDGTLLDYDYQEVQVAKAIIRNARTKILVADASKFQRNAPIRIGTIAEVDYLITDQQPPEEFMAHCRAHHVEVKVAEVPS